MRSLGSVTSVFVFFFILAFAVYPVRFENMSSEVIDLSSYDQELHIWLYEWWGRFLSGRESSLLNTNNLYPFKKTIFCLDLELVPAIVYWGIQKLCGSSPLASFNWMIILLSATSAAAFFLFFKELFRDGLAAFISVFLIWAMPINTLFLSSPQLLFTGLIALFFYNLLRFERSRSLGSLVTAAVILSLQLYTGGYYFYFIGGGFLIYLFSLFFRMPEENYPVCLGCILLFLFLILPVASGYREMFRGNTWTYSQIVSDSLSLSAYFLPLSENFEGGRLIFSCPAGLSPGLVVWGYGTVGFFLYHRQSRRNALIVLGVAILFLLISLGSNGPLDLFFKRIEGFRFARALWRSSFFVGLILVSSAGYVIVRGGKGKVLLALILFGGFIFEYSPSVASTRRISLPERNDIIYNTLASAPGDGLIELPFKYPEGTGPFLSGRYLLRSTRHWKGLVNGYSGIYPRGYYRMLGELIDWNRSGWGESLRRWQVGYVILNRHFLNREELLLAKKVMKREGIQAIIDTGDRVLYRVLDAGGR